MAIIIYWESTMHRPHAIDFGQLPNLCQPLFYSFVKGNSCLIWLLWGLKEVMCIMCLEQWPACYKCCISVRYYYFGFSVTTSVTALRMSQLRLWKVRWIGQGRKLVRDRSILLLAWIQSLSMLFPLNPGAS